MSELSLFHVALDVLYSTLELQDRVNLRSTRSVFICIERHRQDETSSTNSNVLQSGSCILLEAWNVLEGWVLLILG